MIWIIGAGGAIGAAARFLLGGLMKRAKAEFPLGTWVINISGSFLLGILAAFHISNLLSEWLWSFVGIGFCGAYTTFSTFGTETVTLLEEKNYPTAMVYVISSVLIGVLAAAFGYYFVLKLMV
ncbi:fluoride efflux transporter CrcB [Bacillus sp. CECT 9360]|uniref:fluoride efflux transporter CrcB n=1 Tax=Bacillus sp. CECT 9360 TaxID=2845821 RepID=UPI001E2B9661|nr:fluoride efflux transporter CrcB [Bacillus sp. CECT 9360]CAH0344292.1 Putative fluoride ion transporter CrcB [Bacillus sp. CECT 9360]